MSIRSQEEQASIALAHNMYIENWTIKNQLETIIQFPNSGFLISSLYDDHNTPVAVATYSKNSLIINVFVKDNFRNQGYGSKIIDKLIDEHNLYRNEIYACGGIKGSSNFYQKNKIAFYEDGIIFTDEENKQFHSYAKTYNEIVRDRVTKDYITFYENTPSNTSDEHSPKTIRKRL